MTIEKKRGNNNKYIYLGALILILFRLGVYLYKHPPGGTSGKKEADTSVHAKVPVDSLSKRRPENGSGLSK